MNYRILTSLNFIKLGVNMTFIKKYKELRKYLDYKDLDPLGFLINEINYLLGTILYFVFISLKTKPNFIDLLSVALTITASLFILSRIELLFILGAIGFLFVDVWDIVDGQVARHQNSSSIDGEFIDMASQSINHDIIIITMALYSVLEYASLFVLIVSVLLIYARVFRINFIVNHLKFTSKNDLRVLNIEIQSSKVEVKLSGFPMLKNILVKLFYRQYISYFTAILILDFYFFNNIMIIPVIIVAALQTYRRIRDWIQFL